MYPLYPNTRAVRMLAFGEAQVIGEAVVFIVTEKGVVAGARRDGCRGRYGRATSEDNRAGIPALEKYQVLRDCRPSTVGGGDHPCYRTNPAQGRGIDDGGGENMRFCHADCLAA